jgi:hypothetical protein
MPGPIHRNSPLWTPPSRKLDGFDVRPAGDKLDRARADPRIDRTTPEVLVSAFTDDPNLGRPETLHFLESEFTPGPRGIAGPRVHVDMDISRVDGDWLFEAGRPELAATTTYVAARTLKQVAEDHLGMSVPWGEAEALSFGSYDTDTLNLNAHYSPFERNIQLGHAVRAGVLADGRVLGFDPLNPSNNLALVPDVIAHEAGHAIFDHFKPLTALQAVTENSEQAAINEGLADVQAFLVGFRRTEVLARAMTATDRDLSRPNPLSEIGDSVGPVFGLTSPALRSMRNSMVYEPGRPYEEHEGGNLISGAAYDLFAATFQAKRASGDEPHFAAIVASQVSGDLMLNALKFTRDDGGMGFNDFAKGMVLADLSLNGGKNLERVTKVLADRTLISPSQVAELVAQHAAWQQLDLRVDALTVPDGDREAAMKLLPKLREAFGLGEVPLTLSRVERDAHGLLHLVFFQPRANKDSEMKSQLISSFGKTGRDALLSQGAFSITFDARGKVAGVFSNLGTSTEVSIDGFRGDGSKAPPPSPTITKRSIERLKIEDDFSHLART